MSRESDVLIDLDAADLRRKRELDMQHRGCRIALSKWAIRFERLENKTGLLRDALRKIAEHDYLDGDECRRIAKEALDAE